MNFNAPKVPWLIRYPDHNDVKPLIDTMDELVEAVREEYEKQDGWSLGRVRYAEAEKPEITDERLRDVVDRIRTLFEKVDDIQDPVEHDFVESNFYDVCVFMIRKLVEEARA